MTDRELLELAAKAAGAAIVPCTCCDEKWPFKHAKESARRGHWNPIADDGDALRLAVTLEIEIVYRPDWVRASSDRYQGFLAYECLSDRKAATRRAIVRAAAAIGEEIIEEERP